MPSPLARASRQPRRRAAPRLFSRWRGAARGALRCEAERPPSRVSSCRLTRPLDPQAPAAASAPPAHLSHQNSGGGGYAYGFGGGGGAVTYPTLPAYTARDAAPPPQQQRFSPAPPAWSSRGADNGGGGSGGRGPAEQEPGAPPGAVRFRALLLPSSDGGDVADVVAQLGLDGLALVERGGVQRPLGRHALDTVARWAVAEPTVLALWLRPASAGGSEKLLQLSGDPKVVAALLDGLVCAVLQACELRGVACGDGVGRGVNPLPPPATPSPPPPPPPSAATPPGRKPTLEAGAAGVEFWKAPDHSGWLHKKGEHLATWRRRWFVLKDGRLFWFLSDKGITPATKPRGFVPLSGFGTFARGAPVSEAGKPYALEVGCAEASLVGCRHLAADSEADKDAWVAAISRAAASASAAAAASSSSPQAPGGGASGTGGTSGSHEEWAARLREGMESASGGYGGGGYSQQQQPQRERERETQRREQPRVAVVEVAGYSGGGGGGGGYDGYSGGGGGGVGGGGGGWVTHYSADGRAYYHNPATGQTTWDPRG